MYGRFAGTIYKAEEDYCTLKMETADPFETLYLEGGNRFFVNSGEYKQGYKAS
jgi:hypothetical protein